MDFETFYWSQTFAIGILARMQVLRNSTDQVCNLSLLALLLVLFPTHHQLDDLVENEKDPRRCPEPYQRVRSQGRGHSSTLLRARGKPLDHLLGRRPLLRVDDRQHGEGSVLASGKQGPAGDGHAECGAGQGVVGGQSCICCSEEPDTATTTVVVPHVLLTLGETCLGSKDALVARLDVGGKNVAREQVDEVETSLARCSQAQSPVARLDPAPTLHRPRELLVRAVDDVSLLVVHQDHVETSEGNYADYFLEVWILEVHTVEKGAFSKVVDSYMFFPSLYVQPNPNNIVIIRGENNLTKLLDVELESPDHCSKGKSPRDNQSGRLCVWRCLVPCKINTLIFQYLFNISIFLSPCG